MKRFFKILLGALFFLFLIAAIIYKTVTSDGSDSERMSEQEIRSELQTSQEHNPEEFVTLFYSWYLENSQQDLMFPYSENYQSLERLEPWLTDEFITSWDQIAYEIDGSPIFLSGEDPHGWGSKFSVESVSESRASSTVYVTIGSGSNEHSYNVIILKELEQPWQIQSVRTAY